MGEITDALRRAKLQRDSGRGTDPSFESSPRESTVVRAGLDAPLPPEHTTPEPIPSDEVAEGDVEIATFPRLRSGPWPARAVLLDPRQPHTERFRRFALRVRQELQDRGKKSVLVTSPLRAEGKTFTACNLALALSSMAAGGRIALVELDARRPTVSLGLGVTPRVGIEDVIAEVAPLEAARIRTEIPSLDLFLVRESPDHPHDLLARRSLSGIFRKLEQHYDTVVVDSPPTLLVPDVSLVLNHVGGCIVVVRAGISRIKAVRDMIAQIPADKLMGAFVDDVAPPRNLDQYGYYSAEEEAK